MKAQEYQEQILPLISEKFFPLEVRNEWVAFTGFRNQYSPRIDLAVGPFSDQPNKTMITDYNALINEVPIDGFLRQIFQTHCQNTNPNLLSEISFTTFESAISTNQNSRCLLAVEIENTSSKKHIMGSIVNACSLGRVGLGIAYSPSSFRTFQRILNYFGFLRRVGKTSYDTSIFFLLNVDQLNQLLS